MKITNFIFLLLISSSMSAFGDQSTTINMCERIGTTCQDQKTQDLPGKIFRADIDLPTKEQIASLVKDLKASNDPVLKSEFLVMANPFSGQLAARLAGLQVCRQLGFEGVGAVVWTRRLEGVHCLNKLEERKDILAQSTAAVCAITLRNPAHHAARGKGACGYQMNRFKNQIFKVNLADDIVNDLQVQVEEDGQKFQKTQVVQ